MFKKVRNPFIFQGHFKKRKYFEGWYYKLVSKDKTHTLALIPGISLNDTDPHVFIQAFLTNHDTEKPQMKMHYFRFKVDQFKFHDEHKQLLIANNLFSKQQVKLSLQSEKMNIQGILQINHLTPIKNSFFSPSIMGFFGYLKFMECYHGIVSMNHHIKGNLIIDGLEIDFTGGKGYIEKDWGRSFPQSYVWMQSNHFEADTTSFMFSYATIPFIGLKFKGLIVNLIIEGKEYRFATYNRSKIIKKSIEENQVSFIIKRKKLLLHVEAWNDHTISLPSPKNGVMDHSIKEGLSGKIKIQLFEESKLLYRDLGKIAGLEIMMKPKDHK